jgi:1,4-dihydroxy-2-naphthoate octaprenyltransferase
MLLRSTIQLLRFHFSLFLVPVYLFALSQSAQINWVNAVYVFAILHLLVYPSSNGYNSYMDRDQTPIGGLANPMQPTKQLFYISVLMDIIAVAFSIFISPLFAMGILLYILASRAYSYRGIRLKKFPFIGFFTVFVFQGSIIFSFVYLAVQSSQGTAIPWMPAVASSFLIGALYPLTQIYQHKEDKADGVISISYFLGKRGSFLFSMMLFLSAAAVLFIWFNKTSQHRFFYLFLLITLPVVFFFLYWMRKVWQDEAAADFKNSLRMNVIATFSTTVYFLTLIIIKH